MNTIDSLFHEMDRVKAVYDRQSVLNFFFEFASQFIVYNKLPRTQLSYEAIISWKLAGLTKYLQSNYDKKTTMLRQDVTMPSYSCIRSCLEQETKNWNAYWQRVGEMQNGLKKIA